MASFSPPRETNRGGRSTWKSVLVHRVPGCRTRHEPCQHERLRLVRVSASPRSTRTTSSRSSRPDCTGGLGLARPQLPQPTRAAACLRHRDGPRAPSHSSAGIGLANRNPCARSQPSSRTDASCPSTRSLCNGEEPGACARLARLAVIAASFASCSTPWTTTESTLRIVDGKAPQVTERRKSQCRSRRSRCARRRRCSRFRSARARSPTSRRRTIASR